MENGCGVEDLFGRRDIVGGARQQVGRAGDVTQVELAAETDELALGEPILLEELGYHLEIPTPRQVNRVFVPAVERLFLGEIGRVVDVLVKIDVVLDVMLLGVHVLPARQHVFTQHQTAAKFDHLLIERDGGLVRHAFDWPVAGVGIDRRAREHERVHLIGKARCDHC